MNLTIVINKKPAVFAILLAMSFLLGCSNKGAGTADDESSTEAKGKIEVTVTEPRIGKIFHNETLNATTVYQVNDAVHAPISGYIRKINATPGQAVKAGDILFTMQTKEAAALGNIKDSLFRSSGVQVKVTETGIIKSISKQPGDYVQEGDELCTIAENSSLVFMLDVPFEMRKYIKQEQTYTISLPDGEKMQAHITVQAPGMDKLVQMERYILKTTTPIDLPEGLIATVNIPTSNQTNAVILPKSAVLSNETQTEFWVMKLVRDSMAVKVDIEKGIETKDSIQVKSPVFTAEDKVLISGNYGVGDTVMVKISGAKE